MHVSASASVILALLIGPVFWWGLKLASLSSRLQLLSFHKLLAMSSLALLLQRLAVYVLGAAFLAVLNIGMVTLLFAVCNVLFQLQLHLAT